MAFDERKAINGTYGEMWLDGELVRETTALKADISIDYVDVPMCGTLSKRKKMSGLTGTGSATMTKVNSRMALKLSELIKAGKSPLFKIVSKLEDPDSDGIERVVIKNCQFDNLTLVDWSANQIGTITQNFTFTDWEFMDKIKPE